jgi:hypothetical protein
MILTPLEFLALMLFITATAGTIRYIARRRYVQRLQDLADEWKMHFSVVDRFRLAPRIAAKLKVPGAAGVRVVDLVYGIEKENYRYIFAAEYTTGVLRTKTGVRRIATFSEPRDSSGGGEAANGELEFAPDSLPLVEQYRELLQRTRDRSKDATPSC